MSFLLKNDVISLHVPKTGGKAFEQWITYGARVVKERIVNQHYSYSELINVHPEYTDNDYIMIIRNPYARIVSWYHHSRDVYTYSINRPAQKDKNHPPESPRFSPSFEDWVRKEDLRDFPAFTKNRTAGSFGTMKSYLHPSGRMPTYLLHQETLADDLKPLRELWETDAPLTTENKSSVSFSGNNNWKNEFKSDYTKDFIYEYFKEDFETFGYDRKFPTD
jgi:hypothetical protein